MRVGEIGPRDDHLCQPIVSLRNGHVGPTAEVRFEDVGQLAIRAGNAPLRRAMDDPFRLALSRVKRLDRVGVVMAENSRRVDRVAPLLRSQRFDGSPVPQLGRRDGTAPIVVAHMQHMIAKVFELVVGSLRSIEVDVDVGETQIPPVLGRIAAKLMKGIQRELVVRAGTLPRKQHIEEGRGHRRGLANGGELILGIRGVVYPRWQRPVRR